MGPIGRQAGGEGIVAVAALSRAPADRLDS